MEIYKQLLDSNWSTLLFVGMIVLTTSTLVVVLSGVRPKYLGALAILLMYILTYVGVKQVSQPTYKIFLAVYVLPGLITLFLLETYRILKSVLQSKKETDLMIYFRFKNGKGFYSDLSRGVGVQGAAGSGKTVSVAGQLLAHFSEKDVPGVVYDYKEFELTEMVLGLYKKSKIPVRIYSPFDPQYSVKINPIAPEIIRSHEDISMMARCIVDNLLRNDKSDDFWKQTFLGAIIGVMYVLRDHHPERCDLPHLVSIMLGKETDELISFIRKSEEAKIHARAFLDSAESERQMAAVKSTMANALSVFANPKIFYSLQKSETSLRVNDPNDSYVLCLVNQPKYDKVYSPILSIVCQAVILEMSRRKQRPAYLLIDEAPTLRINDIAKVPATMRSFGVSTIYMLQDKIQAAVQLGDQVAKEVFTNLSTLFLGKTNDPDTAKYFESYMAMVKKKRTSVSRRSELLVQGPKTVTTSYQDEKEHRYDQMFRRKKGEFFILDQEGKSYNTFLKKPIFTSDKPKAFRELDDNDYKDYFNEVIRESRNM